MKNTGRRKRTAVAAAAIGSAGASAIAATPAQAFNVPSHCRGTTSIICVTKDHGFHGPARSLHHSLYDLDYSNNHYESDQDESLNNSISSVWNRSSTRWVKFFRKSFEGGPTLCVAPGAAEVDLENRLIPGQVVPEPEHWGDKISGHRTYPGEPAACGTTISDPACSI